MTPRTNRLQPLATLLAVIAALATFGPLSLHAAPPDARESRPARPLGAPPDAPIYLAPPASLTSGTNATGAATSNVTVSGNPNERISINWSAMPLSMLIPEIEKLTGRTVIRPATLPNVADLTLTFGTPPTRAEALQAVETLFGVNQLAIIPVGDKLLKLVPITGARTEAPAIIEGSTLTIPPSGRIGTKLFQLEFLRAAEFAQQIPTMLNDQIRTISIFERSNAILITDSITTLQRIELLLKEVDRPASTPVQAKFYTLEFAKASDMVNKFKTIFQGPLQQQLGASTTFNADDRTNQVFVIGDPRQFPFFDDLIKKLDTKADPNTRNEVIRLRSAVCTDVATLLNNVISGQLRAAQAQQAAGGTTSTQRQGTTTTGAPATTGQNQNRNATRTANTQGATTNRTAATPASTSTAVAPSFASNISAADLGLNGDQFSSYITVQPDTRTNSIVVSGTVDDIRIIKELIEKLDVLLSQVRIEVVIAEVTLTDAASSGISSLGLQVQDNKLVGFNASGAGFGTGASVTNNSDGSISPSGYVSIARIAGNYSLSGLIGLTTTPRKNNTTIVSMPSITTMHNKQGKIFFGETRPVVTASTVNPGSTGNATTSSVTQMEIGTTITITPLIGYDGSVQLDVQQEISDVTGNVQVDQNVQYIIGKRNTTSTVIVKSGDIIVLGGIQKNSFSKTTSRLGPIPVIGDLIGSRTRSKTRTELIFFLRPIVLTNTATDNAPAYQQLEQMSNKDDVKQLLGMPTSDNASAASQTAPDAAPQATTGGAALRPRR